MKCGPRVTGVHMMVMPDITVRTPTACAAALIPLPLNQYAPNRDRDGQGPVTRVRYACWWPMWLSHPTIEGPKQE